MDPAQVLTSVTTALEQSSDAAESLLRNLFRAYSESGPSDWADVEQVLSAQLIVEHETATALLGMLKTLTSEAGSANDPRVVFDDPDLRGYFATDTQGTATDLQGATPVLEGSLISRVGDAYYLGDNHQVWQARSGDSVYYHDGTHNYDTLGRPLEPLDAVPRGAARSEHPGAWNTYLAQNGPRWDGTEDSWQQFRDWFVYDAAAHQVGDSAHSFIALAESGDKRAVFADYGVTLPIAAGDHAAADRAIAQSHDDASTLAQAAIPNAAPSANPANPNAPQTVAELQADQTLRQHLRWAEDPAHDRLYRPTNDGLGHPTVGHGYNLDQTNARRDLAAVGANYDAVRNGTQALTDAQVEQLFNMDIDRALRDARNFYAGFDQLDATRQRVLVDMAFNMGGGSLGGFQQFHQALVDGDYNRAANEMQHSRWYNQVIRRSAPLVQEMRTGVPQRRAR